MKTRLAMAAAAILVLATLALAGCGPKTPVLGDWEQAWVERMLDHLHMTGEERIRDYPLNARDALAYAAKIYAGSEGDFVGDLQEGTQVTLFCDDEGLWYLTWRGTYTDESSGRVYGWTERAIINATTGHFKYQVNDDYNISEPEQTSTP